jgi:hypothetical protein
MADESKALRELIEGKVQGKLKWGVVSEDVAILETENGEERHVDIFCSVPKMIMWVLLWMGQPCWRELTFSIPSMFPLKHITVFLIILDH